MSTKVVSGKARKWSFSEESALVDLYRNRPQLWDPSTPGYKKKHIRAQLFTEICDQLGIDPATVQDKVRKMRIYFFQLYKKDCGGNRRSGSDSAAEAPHTITWPFYSSLMFLQEARKRRLSNGHIDSEEDESELQKKHEEREAESSESGTSELFSPSSPSEGRNLDDSYVREDRDEELVPRSLSKDVEARSDDEEDIFGKLVAKRLKRIPDQHQRDETKRQIMQFLYSPQYK